MCTFYFAENSRGDRVAKRTGSHLNLCPNGIKDFMNDVDGGEPGLHSYAEGVCAAPCPMCT